MIEVPNPKIYEARATRGTTVKRSRPRTDLVDCDLPTINIGSNIENLDDYYDDLIQAYNKYLGYPSEINTTKIHNVFNYGLKVYCIVKCLKRYYDSNECSNNLGKEVNGYFDKMIVITTGSDENYASAESRIDNSLKGISNKVWAANFISKVERVLLPQPIMALYDYYLSTMFDISNNNNKEALTWLRFWPTFENELISDTTYHDDLSKFKITRSMFESAYASYRSYLTKDVKDFIINFLGWVNPNEDWTRDIQGQTLLINRDEKLISTFNNIYPEHVAVNTGSYAEGTMENTPNMVSRYYYDFEQLLDSNTKSEPVATLYYFGIDGINLEQAYMTSQALLDKFNLNYNDYPLLTMLCSEEAAGSRTKYVGGMRSIITSINDVTGDFIDDTEIIKQFCFGNDVTMEFYDEAKDLHHEDTGVQAKPTMYADIMGDYGEAGDVRDQLAILNFPIRLVENWRVMLKMYDNELRGYLFDAVVNGSFDGEWTSQSQTSSYDFTSSHKDDFTSYNTYTIDPSEAHLAMYSIMFLMLTGFYDSRTANNAIKMIFKGKQQETQA